MNEHLKALEAHFRSIHPTMTGFTVTMIDGRAMVWVRLPSDGPNAWVTYIYDLEPA